MANREQTFNDHRARLNAVLTHIQENIDKPLSLEALAAIAFFSPFHFHRIFSAHIGETLFDHIRRIRLEKAAQKLRSSKEQITDIALSAGYETPAAFGKAFKQLFGKNPSDYRDLKRQESGRAESTMNIFPEKRVEPKIEYLPAQDVLFVRKMGKYDLAASEAWGALMKFAYSNRIMNKDTKCIGISHDSPDITSEERIRYDACIPFSRQCKPHGEIGIQTIPEGRYAVFVHKGPYATLGETYDFIMAHWYPASGNKLLDRSCFEVYLNGNPQRTKPENIRTEIYVPIE